MKFYDLQVHTTASDGVLSPKEIVDRAENLRMKAIAITDHDSVSGINEALSSTNKLKSLEVVPGIELSCRESLYDGTIDVLGLFINHESVEMNNFIRKLRGDRVREKKQMIIKLNNLGYEISFEELLKNSGESLGRPVIARILLKKYPEKFSSVRDVFDKLIGQGKPAYVGRELISIREAINIIHKSGGIAILAHPGRYENSFRKIIEEFVNCDGDGIEADYPYQKVMNLPKEMSDKINKIIKEIAKEKKLLVSGGSDFHDESRGSAIGDGGVDENEFLLLKKARNRRD